MTPTLDIHYGANWFVRAFALLLAGLAVLAATASPAQSGTVQVRVDNPELAKAFAAAASGMRLGLNSDAYGPSELEGPYIGYRRFSLPKFVHTVSGGLGGLPFPNSTIRARLSDVNSLDFEAHIEGKYVELIAPFENDGTELLLECATAAGGACPLAPLIDSLLNNAIHLEDAKLTIRLRMSQWGTWIAHDDDLNYIDVSFDAKVRDIGGVCGVFVGLCPQLQEYVSNLVEYPVRHYIREVFGSIEVANKLAELARQQLVDDGVIGSDWRLLRFDTSRGFWTLTMVRPPFIDAGTVRIVDFRPLTKHVAHTCPVDIGFTASISVSTSVSGRVWLRHENGTISPKLNWSSGAGLASSRLTRIYRLRASKRPGDRWSKLVVEWQDEWGQTYQTTSSAAKYSVTCLEPTDSLKNG